MKANIVKPSSGLKAYKFDVNMVEVERQDEWNSFSTSPREGENWTQYSFLKGNESKVMIDTEDT